MRLIKILVFLIISLILIYILYLLVISPSVTIINNTDNTIKVTKGEFQNYKSDPDLIEVEDMLNNIVSVKPKSSYSYGISSKTILSKDKIRIDVSYAHGETLAGESFKISKYGDCKYKINVYDGFHLVETNKFSLCYKKLQLVK